MAFRIGAVPVALLAIGAGVCGALPAAAAEQPMICTNPASGAHWQIVIDAAKGTVNSFPATITDRKVTWHDDKDGGNYSLDRASGKLTVIVPSSTGGYFLYDRCEAKN